MIKQNEHRVARAEVGSQDFGAVTEHLHGRVLARDQFCDEPLGGVGIDAFAQPDELGHHPVEYGGDQGGVLEVRIDPVGEMGDVPAVADVVDDTLVAAEIDSGKARVGIERAVPVPDARPLR